MGQSCQQFLPGARISRIAACGRRSSRRARRSVDTAVRRARGSGGTVSRQRQKAPSYTRPMPKPAKPRRRSPDLKALGGTARAAPPAELEPQKATLVERAPEGEAWLHELKFDGYRLLA